VGRRRKIPRLWHGQKSDVFELEADIAGTNDHLECNSLSQVVIALVAYRTDIDA
jgi:hypothetical protein